MRSREVLARTLLRGTAQTSTDTEILTRVGVPAHRQARVQAHPRYMAAGSRRKRRCTRAARAPNLDWISGFPVVLTDDEDESRMQRTDWVRANFGYPDEETMRRLLEHDTQQQSVPVNNYDDANCPNCLNPMSATHTCDDDDIYE